MHVRFTPSARVEFLNAIESIRRNDRSVAQKFRRESGTRLNRLSRFPNSGAAVAEFPDLPSREIYIKLYRFFYRVEEGVVWIVSVWYGAQVPDGRGPS